ncbi:hypothetical protein [Dyella flagellata]|uniref:Uncharacterized protein n=1 Tax=Dyella flagellata TaxID=1867833 RepID=A0ABQ5X6L0_9GAMM|nr:hypothetical protein [Dyella flagellata]GLQ87266.1 hypothetical protein GCM10007898_08320 [Dyella flagellata]
MAKQYWLGLNDRRSAWVFGLTLFAVTALVGLSVAKRWDVALDLAALASFAGGHYFTRSRGLSVFSTPRETYQAFREGRAHRATGAENVLWLIGIALVGILMYTSFIAPFT